MKSKKEVVKQFATHKTISSGGLSEQYANTRACNAFYAGDTLDYRGGVVTVGRQGSTKRVMVEINKVKPSVNFVTGFFIQNRRKSEYAARMPDSQVGKLYSRYANSLNEYIRDNTNADQEETQQDRDMFTVGYGATETAMTYTEGYTTTDPNGEILIGRLDPERVAWDPHARKTNLLDARWVYYSQDYRLQDALDTFDDANEDDLEYVASTMLGTGYHYEPNLGRYDRAKIDGGVATLNPEWADKKEELVRVHFYQWQETETFWRADNPIYTLQNPLSVQRAGLELDRIAGEEEDVSEYSDLFTFDPRAKILTFTAKTKTKLLESFGEYIKCYPYKRKVFYSAVISGEKCFTRYRSISQQGFTVKFKTGDWNAKRKIWMGLVNSMMEPQLYYNKGLTELMFIIAANSKGGVMIEEDAVEDVADFEQKWAKTDATIIVNSGAISGGKILAKTQPSIPSGYENIVAMMDTAIPAVNGFDPAQLMSPQTANENGVLHRQRVKLVFAILAPYADSCVLYSKEQSRLELDFQRIYAENNDGGLFRLFGEDGQAEYATISKDHMSAEYDVLTQEAPTTPEEEAETASTLSNMGTALLSVDPVAAKKAFAVSLKYMRLKDVDVQDMLPFLEPQGPQLPPEIQQQLEQMQAVIEQQQQQIQILSNPVTQADAAQKASAAELNKAKTEQILQEIEEGEGEKVADHRAEQYKTNMNYAATVKTAQLNNDTKVALATIQALTSKDKPDGQRI